MSNLLTFERASEAYSYCSESGEIRWKIRPCRNMKAGIIAGTVNKEGYIRLHIDRRFYSAHRVAWLLHYGQWPEGEVDHIDGDPSNNRIGNLRVVDPIGNRKNQGVTRRNSSGCVGVRWIARKGCWESKISSDRKHQWLGYFKSLLDAASSRKSAEIKNGFHPNHGMRPALTASAHRAQAQSGSK